MIKTLLYRYYLPRILAKACESRIPRSGFEGAAVNCYVVELDRDGSPNFLATGFAEDTITGLKWDGHKYCKDFELPLSNFVQGKPHITHYYGLSTVVFDSIFRFSWHQLTRIVYLNIRIYRYIDSTFQYFFNKTKLVTKTRMELLRFMMDDQLDRTHKGISSLTLLEKIYSMRLFLHPSWGVQLEKLELYLDSLVNSGELEKVNDEYVVTGVSITTIERYEEEERRHAEAVKLQRKMFWLTLVAVVFAIIETGIVKLPIIVDWSGGVTP